MKNLFLTLSFTLLAAFFIQVSWANTQTDSDSDSSSVECIIKRLEQEIAALNASLTSQVSEISLLQQANSALNASLTSQVSQLQQANLALNASLTSQVSQVLQLQQANSALNASLASQVSEVSQLQQANSALNASLTSQVSQLQQANSALSAALTAQINQANSNLKASLTSKISQVQQQVSDIPDTITQQVAALGIPKTESGFIFRSEGDSGYGLIGSDGERKTDCSPVTFKTPFSSIPVITAAIAQLSDDSDHVSLLVYPADITESGFTICGATMDVITDYNAVWVALGSP